MSGDQVLLSKVTRIEVIDATGRTFSRHYSDVGVTLDVQDDGRTVKVFAGSPVPTYGEGRDE